MFTNPLFWALLPIGAVIGYLVRHIFVSKRSSSVEQEVKVKLEEAQTQAKEIVIEAKAKAVAFLDEAKKEEKEQKAQIARLEERLIKREEQVEKQQQELGTQKTSLEKETQVLKSERVATEELKQKILKELERVAKLSFDEAKKQLIDKIKEENKNELVVTMQKLEKERLEEIEKRSLEVITTAIQRYARSHVSDVTTSVFHLPNEELKGKIIGREGRNIRTLERLTGVEIIVDEMPDSVVFSSFDPLRREIARLSCLASSTFSSILAG